MSFLVGMVMTFVWYNYGQLIGRSGNFSGVFISCVYRGGRLSKGDNIFFFIICFITVNTVYVIC